MAEAEFIQNMSAIGLIALFLIVIRPLISVFAQKMEDKLNGRNGYSRLEQRIQRIESNHLGDIERRLNNHDKLIEKIREELEEIKIDVAKIKFKVGINNK